MKGIILAGGSGTRLHPITLAVCKQLLPVYNKPMIYYPLSVLMLAGIKEILIISTAHDLPAFKRLLGNGSRYGLTIDYVVQSAPRGLADAFLVGEAFIGKGPLCLILGDNIFYGNHLQPLLLQAVEEACKERVATIFGSQVDQPQRYGIAELDEAGALLSLQEKPVEPRSNIAVTGLYFYDNDVVEMAKSLKPSARGELEITDINKIYLEQKRLKLTLLGRGFIWLDAGTYSSLMQAGQLVQVFEERAGLYIAAIEEIAYRQGFIDSKQLLSLANELCHSPYGQYLKEQICTDAGCCRRDWSNSQ